MTWTQLLTLRLGHTTAAASTVLAAFMGGLALGAALGGRVASRLSRRRSLFAYAGLEAVVIAAALSLPWQIDALTPLLRWAYHDGASGALYPFVRVVASMGVLIVPASALGATFPIAVRWFVEEGDGAGNAGTLYAANTCGAAIGALGAGFALIPALGTLGTTFVGASVSALSVLLALSLAPSVASQPSAQAKARRFRAQGASALAVARQTSARAKDGALAIVALTGVATLVLEIGWTRVFALIVGPSTYAFSAVLAVFIGGLACGSAIGSRVARDRKHASFVLGPVLACAAVAAVWATSFAGGPLPRVIAADLAGSPLSFLQLLATGTLWMTALILPTGVGLGLVFPIALHVAGDGDPQVSRAVAAVYAINTIACVSGSLAAGFLLLPLGGLQNTLRIADAALLAAAVVATAVFTMPAVARAAALFIAAAGLVLVVSGREWDRELLASGAYKYARYMPAGPDVDRALTAGTLLYYRDGAAATVSVKDLTGARSMAIDGKIDASTGGDMVTQKALAHLPLLLHPTPRTVCIIGLGSGVTLGSALVHPVASVDVLEVSPEVVEASRYFAHENRHALDDHRTRLIVGDGRSHLLLASEHYDVIVSEPSNPWMAGVAALFTREFFVAARARLAPGGVLCQWAHAYDISPADLQSIVATFASVFPDGTMWLIGEGDVLLVGSDGPLDSRLAAIERGWMRPGVAADLASVGVMEPFGFLSAFVGGGEEIARYAQGARLQTDNRMALEFSGPRAVNLESPDDNAAALIALREHGRRRPAVAGALAAAGAAEWRNRAAMMWQANAYRPAYDDYARALALDPSDSAAAMGLVRAAAASARDEAAATLLTRLAEEDSARAAPRIALSRLRASHGQIQDAIDVAVDACRAKPPQAAAFEQLASIYADVGDADALSPVVDTMTGVFPEHPATRYYAAALRFLRGQLPEALALTEHAMAADASRAATRNLLGVIHASQGNVGAARDAFRAALAIDPRDTATYTNLARLELTASNPAVAQRLFTEALTLDPKSEVARQGLAEARTQRFQ